jgi:CheY-like chemotaxis protein
MLVYLIDDDLEDQEIFDLALYETGITANLKCFDNALSVIERLKNSGAVPDFMFLDLNMPKVNGLECLEILSNDNFTNKSRIIIYSTSSNEKDKTQTLALGAHDYLIKPASFVHLVESIREILSVS